MDSRMYIDRIVATTARIIAEIENKKPSYVMREAFEEWVKAHNYEAVMEKVKKQYEKGDKR